MDNTLELIDSRELTDRIEELHEIHTMTIAESLELAKLHRVAALGKLYGEDWEYGCPIIRHSYFVEYIKSDFSESYGEELSDMPNIFVLAIDWNIVAEIAMIDYTEIDFAGEAYYVRTNRES